MAEKKKKRNINRLFSGKKEEARVMPNTFSELASDLIDDQSKFLEGITAIAPETFKRYVSEEQTYVNNMVFDKERDSTSLINDIGDDLKSGVDSLRNNLVDSSQIRSPAFYDFGERLAEKSDNIRGLLRSVAVDQSPNSPDVLRSLNDLFETTVKLDEQNGEVYKQPKSPAEKARDFRRERIRSGALGEFLEKVPTTKKLRKAIEPMLLSVDSLRNRTMNNGDTHRGLVGMLAGMLTDEKMRPMFMKALDKTAKENTKALKAEIKREGHLETDVLVVGTGVNGAVFASELRAENPDLRIVGVDRHQKLGGQFREYGERPIFHINSRNRAQNNDAVSLPGERGNINSFGKNAPLQMTDFTHETYPTNSELGDTTAINFFLSAETMMGQEVERITKEKDGNFKVILTDAKNGKERKVIAKKVVVASGLGDRVKFEKDRNKEEKIWSAEDFFKHFADPENDFPMKDFVDKSVAIVGAGDTGRVIAELLTRLAPKEAYGKSVVQMGGPRAIYWYGTDFSNKEEFCAVNRSRYRQLASFIGRTGQFLDDNANVIIPDRTKPQNIQQNGFGEVEITIGEFDTRGVDIVIDATGLEPQEDYLLPRDQRRKRSDVSGERSSNFNTTPSYLRRATIAEETPDGVYFIGPSTGIKLSSTERSTFNNQVKENTSAIWANGPRAAALASVVANEIN